MTTLLVAFVALPLTAGLIAAAIVFSIEPIRRHRARARAGDQEPAIVRPEYGADPQFGAELHALRDADVSPELISEIEVELAWAMAWHDLETVLRVELDRICDPVIAALDAPRTFDELRDLLDLPGGLVTL